MSRPLFETRVQLPPASFEPTFLEVACLDNQAIGLCDY